MNRKEQLMNKKLTIINITSSVILQILSIISGFILPKIILTTFGSEVNGLVSSLNQFLGYISLLEGGVTGVISACLYEPIVKHDQQKLSQVIKTADDFFKKIAVVFAVYTAILSVVYPIAVHTGFSFSYVCSLIWVMCIGLFVQYFFSLSMRVLLNADKKVYTVCLTQAIIISLNTVITVAVSKIYPSIHLLKLCSSCLYLLQPIIFNRTVKRVFHINKAIKPDQEIIKQRWNGFGINMAAFIHNNTDMIVLTIFSSLKDVSIYSIYFLVVTGLKNLIISISGAIAPGIGQAYARGNQKELRDKFTKYEFTILYITCIAFTVGGLCITPFILLYTKNIHDVNYNQPLFGWLIVTAEMLFCIREPYVAIAYAANRFKDFTKTAYIEAILNIILSVILVIKFGIIGVAVGTLISMGYRTILQIGYLHNHILHKRLIELYKNVAGFLVGMIVVVSISNNLIYIGKLTIFNWIVFAFKNTICSVIVFSLITICLYKLDLKNNLKKDNRK